MRHGFYKSPKIFKFKNQHTVNFLGLTHPINMQSIKIIYKMKMIT